MPIQASTRLSLVKTIKKVSSWLSSPYTILSERVWDPSTVLYVSYAYRGSSMAEGRFKVPLGPTRCNHTRFQEREVGRDSAAWRFDIAGAPARDPRLSKRIAHPRRSQGIAGEVLFQRPVRLCLMDRGRTIQRVTMPSSQALHIDSPYEIIARRQYRCWSASSEDRIPTTGNPPSIPTLIPHGS